MKMIKEKNLYLEYVVDDLSMFAESYLLNKQLDNIDGMNEIDVSAYWTISKALNNEVWYDIKDKIGGFNHLWKIYRNNIEFFEKELEEYRVKT